MITLWHKLGALLYRKLPQVAALAILLTAIMVAVDEALARAGGGGSYRRRTSTGGGGGGGGIEGLIFEILFRFLFRLCIEKPVIGIPLTIVVIYLVWRFYRNADSIWNNGKDAELDFDETANGSGLARPETRRSHAAAELAGLKNRDPAFAEEQFKERVRRTFLEVQGAWAQNALTRVKPLVTAGVQERFEILLDMNKRRMLKNVMKDVAVKKIEIRGADSDDLFDAIQVRIDAVAIDYYDRIDPQGAGKTLGRTSPQAFAEYWSFLRKKGARSIGQKGLAYGSCPCCGAGLKISDKGECEYCKTVVNSGEHDWVLAEITQTGAGETDVTVAGLAALKKKDPAFSPQWLEDRVSLMFWRLRAGEMMGSQKPVQGIARDTFVKKRSARYALHLDGRNAFFADCAVGAVQIVHVEAGVAGEKPDRVHVRVKWSGREVKAKLPTFLPPRYEESQHRDQEYIVERAAEAVTPAGRGMQARACPGCGAPETRMSGASCARCGQALAGGDTDWVLADVREFSPVRSQSRSDVDMAPNDARVRHPEGDQLVAAAVMVLLADGKVSAQEEAWVVEFAAQREITPQKLKEIVSQVRRREYPEIRIRNEAAKKGFLTAMLRACMADGEISPAEEALIVDLARRLKLDPEEAKQRVREARARLGRGGGSSGGGGAKAA